VPREDRNADPLSRRPQVMPASLVLAVLVPPGTDADRVTVILRCAESRSRFAMTAQGAMPRPIDDDDLVVDHPSCWRSIVTRPASILWRSHLGRPET
jgi:hypothetical protein